MPDDRDDCITQEQIRTIHERIARMGFDAALNDLSSREASLAAYAICTAAFVADIARTAGAPRRLFKWLEKEVLARTIVCLEAQREAHYELWRDLMGDGPEPAEPEGDPMETEQQPRLSAVALASRSDKFASTSWTPEDVRQLRPAWSGSEARYFLEKHGNELASMIQDAGWAFLLTLIEKFEAELRRE